MVYVVGLLSLVFLVLAILVLTRLTSILKGVNAGDTTEEIERIGGTGNRVNAFLFIGFFVVGAIAVAWSFLHARQYFLPEASSPHGRHTDGLFWLVMAIITIAFVVTNALLFFFAYKYQYRKGHKATYYPENHKLELIWTVIPAVVMALLVFTGWRAWRDITSEAPENALNIEIVGRQFNWEMRYPGVDNNKLGNYNYKLIDANNVIGLDLEDEASFDDVTTSTEMHIPVNRPVLLKIRARDVLHSVFIPHMRVKMDAVPGMPTRFWFIADKTTDEMRNETGNPDFKYEIACTEVCGQGHFSMRTTLVVEDEESYNKWMAQQKPWLTKNPDYLARVPDKLKAKAAKYIPADAGAQAPSDSTAAPAEEGAGAAPSAALR
ncbi:cytochrome c oxidase subunit II [Larkinella arboricola]|uniref:Cytochrome c oxidase subunit 2 n=1 Tax=Larkinella arboricola TaxID=643671 RepID=A0A327X7V8_LARAB|nr:cytochrome c oxidase subunit II [Larkinella arboricola]RAK02174.1 cytochrome c oxidase subunit 2 [Larkinella arboricola]